MSLEHGLPLMVILVAPGLEQEVPKKREAARAGFKVFPS
jgi:hypothetical protein